MLCYTLWLIISTGQGIYITPEEMLKYKQQYEEAAKRNPEVN